MGKGIAFMGTNLSPALLGVGYIVGLNIGVLALIGGMISWNLAIPIYSAFFLDGNPELAASLAGASAEDAAGAIWSAQIRYLGVGAMLVGGVWRADLDPQLARLRHSQRSRRSACRRDEGGGPHRAGPADEGDPRRHAAVRAAAVRAVPEHRRQHRREPADDDHHDRRGFLFCSVSAYMAGLVGSSNNPVSGITICTILFASLVLMMLMGRDAALEQYAN